MSKSDQSCWRHAVRAALCVVLSSVLAACGGDGADTGEVTADRARAAATIVWPPPTNPPPTPLPSPRFVATPQNATVGVGAGVLFGTWVAGHGPFTYQWHKNGAPIATATSSQYTIASATTGDAATYMVRVADRFGSTITASATLSVVQGQWARLSGRSIYNTTPIQQPALALCAQPSIAHILPSTNRNALYVKYFDGTSWRHYGTGGILNATSTGSASDPSIDCVNDGTTYRPIVAWSEGNATARDIFVKYWDGTAWQSAGNGPLTMTAGALAQRPALRTTPFDLSTGNGVVGGVTRRSAVAWIENGVPTVRYWDNGWLTYAGGGQIPGGASASDISLTIELDDVGRTYPPLVAWLAPNGNNLQQFAATHNAGLSSWVQMGAPLTINNVGSPAIAAGRIGIGVGKYLQGRTPVAVWADTSSPSLFRSWMYPSEHFVNGVANQSWERYGSSFSVSGAIKTTAFDPREFRRQGANACALGNLPTFGLAISYVGGFEVRRSTCGMGLSPADWGLVRTAHNVALEEIALRMAGEDDPIVAGTQLVNGKYELSVWKYYP